MLVCVDLVVFVCADLVFVCVDLVVLSVCRSDCVKCVLI